MFYVDRASAIFRLTSNSLLYAKTFVVTIVNIIGKYLVFLAHYLLKTRSVINEI